MFLEAVLNPRYTHFMVTLEAFLEVVLAIVVGVGYMASGACVRACMCQFACVCVRARACVGACV